jgi:release factor glutamine methyltransferase
VRVANAVTDAAAKLTAAGVGSARADAELLAAHVLGIARGQLWLAGDFTGEQERRFSDLVNERAARVPLQHLTGTAPFRHLQLAVGPGVFVPRPETEVLVEWGLRWLRDRSSSSARLVVDLCAGAGAIAASVASEAPQTRVYAVEWDPAALRWLRPNVSGLAVTVVEGDATDPATLSELDGRVDLVLCNPPYVPEIGAAGLPAEVSEHDPHGAVFAGTDGLQVIRALIPRAAALLCPGGAVGIEHDDTHAYVVPTLVAADGRLTNVELHHDLARRPRFTTATRAGDGRRMADFTL